MKRRCIVNFAQGGWYPKGQARLIESLDKVGFGGHTLAFESEFHLRSPAHSESPYAFKPHAINEAFRFYDSIIWADSSVFAIRDPGPMFDYIEEHGYVFFANANTGEWSSDASLASFNITREQAFEIPMMAALCMGFDAHRATPNRFLAEWLFRSKDGVTFQGAWDNAGGRVSKDPRVKGHRHDQTAASIIAWKLGMKQIIGHETFFQYYENPTKTRYEENPDLSLIGPSVCFVAQGMA